jgi:hypothetical protein
MNRRTFVQVSLAGALTAKLGISADGFITKMDRNARPFGTPAAGGALQDIFEATGWQLELNEHAKWKLIVHNPGPQPIRVVYSKPFAAGPHWQIVKRFQVEKTGPNGQDLWTWRPDNEDHHFFVEQLSGGVWKPFDGSPANSNAGLTPDAKECGMSWNSPQNIHLNVRFHSFSR